MFHLSGNNMSIGSTLGKEDAFQSVVVTLAAAAREHTLPVVCTLTGWRLELAPYRLCLDSVARPNARWTGYRTALPRPLHRFGYSGASGVLALKSRYMRCVCGELIDKPGEIEETAVSRASLVLFN